MFQNSFNIQFCHRFLLQLFADKGIIAIEHADFDGNEMLALVGYTNIEVFKVI